MRAIRELLSDRSRGLGVANARAHARDFVIQQVSGAARDGEGDVAAAAAARAYRRALNLAS